MSRAVLQMLNVLASVGLGHFGNAFTFGAAVAAAAFGALWASWREDIHLLWLEPGARTFAVCAILYWVLYREGAGFQKRQRATGAWYVMCHVGVSHHSTRRSEATKRGAGVV